MPLQKYQVKITDKKEIATKTLQLSFEKPEGFTFSAGQFVNIRLPHLVSEDKRGNSRSFSLAAAPFEHDLFTVMRLTDSAFKKTIQEMPIGSPMEILGPSGGLTMVPETEKPIVFLAGGVGITPLRSIIKDEEKKGFPHHLTLIYSDRRPENTAFFEELNSIHHKNFHLVLTMTDLGPEDSSWQGERGRLDALMIKKHTPDLTGSIYYIVGAPQMVLDLRKTLLELGVPQNQIKFELFSGY